MILTVTLNACVDHVVFVSSITLHDANRVARAERDAGGKGVNLSRVVAELGGQTVASGFLGGGVGAFVRAVLDNQGVRHAFTESAGETRTNFSVEDGSGQPPTSFNQRGPEISEAEWSAFVKSFTALAKEAAWVSLAGSMPPGVPAEAYRILAGIAHEQGCRVMLDADGEALKLGLEAKPDFIKPNEPEAGRLLGRPVESAAAAMQAARELRAHVAEGGFVVVSRGENGAVLSSPAGDFVGHTPVVQVKSTVGSGDSLIAGMLWAIQDGRSLPEAFQWGLTCGAATASTDGSEIARRAVVESLFPNARVEPA